MVDPLCLWIFYGYVEHRVPAGIKFLFNFGLQYPYPPIDHGQKIHPHNIGKDPLERHMVTAFRHWAVRMKSSAQL